MVNLDNNTIYIITIVMIFTFGLAGLAFSAFSVHSVSKIKLNYSKAGDSVSLNEKLVRSKSFETSSGQFVQDDEEAIYVQSENYKIYQIQQRICSGAFSFLRTEYITYAPALIVSVSLLILLIGLSKNFTIGIIGGASFLTGSLISLISGLVGMAIATYTNGRTTLSASKNMKSAFNTAYSGALGFGFFMPSLGVIAQCGVTLLSAIYFQGQLDKLSCSVANMAIGGSLTGVFLRICGGIYTKAADVGADMVGKVEANLKEDDPRNPAVIADNVGDNVGDIAGMGADLYGSFGEATSATMIIIAYSKTLKTLNYSIYFPILLLSSSIVAAIFSALIPLYFKKPEKDHEVEFIIKLSLLVNAILVLASSGLLCYFFLPNIFTVHSNFETTSMKCFICIAIGIFAAILIAAGTEYYTSSNYRPVIELAESSETGPATLIIFGLSLGSASTLIQGIILMSMLFICMEISGQLGVTLSALGILCMTPAMLTIDSFGPICDNAGGIAEMACLDENVRELTDQLDHIGNITAAIGKAFSMAAAFPISVALTLSYVEIMMLSSVNILNGMPLCGIVIGSIMPPYFMGILNKSVGHAAAEMVKEVRRQFRNEAILNHNAEPDYDQCIVVATKASLEKTAFPMSILLTPLLVLLLFGPKALVGFIVGIIASGIPAGTSANNSGGAWDNAKKYIEAGYLGEGKGKNSVNHHAAIIGDTVGDPMKDTSGPCVNTMIKVSAIIPVALHSVFPKEGLFARIF